MQNRIKGKTSEVIAQNESSCALWAAGSFCGGTEFYETVLLLSTAL